MLSIKNKDLSCMYLAQHQLKSEFFIIDIILINIIIIIIVIIIVVVTICRCGRDPGGPQGCRSWTGHNKLFLRLAWQQQNQTT